MLSNGGEGGVRIITNQPDAKSNPNPNRNPTTKQQVNS